MAFTLIALFTGAPPPFPSGRGLDRPRGCLQEGGGLHPDCPLHWCPPPPSPQVEDSIDPVAAARRVVAFAKDMLRCSREVRGRGGRGGAGHCRWEEFSQNKQNTGIQTAQ